MTRMKNTPKSVEAAQLIAGTSWAINDDIREITRIENAKVSQHDDTIFADVYWRKPGGKERKNPTPLTTFRTWLNKATKQSH